jgi:hypothetical protein
MAKLKELLAETTWPRPLAEHEAEYNADRRHPPKLGTCWVAPGQGSTWWELRKVFGEHDGACKCPFCVEHDKDHTNLRLTGWPITQEDRIRWESGLVE